MRTIRSAIAGVVGLLLGCGFAFAQAGPAAAGPAAPAATVAVTPAKPVAAQPDSTNALKRVHAFVSGKVQGVGFRAFTSQKASTLSLTGWVKNLDDGRVELVAEGPAAAIGKLIEAVAKGPAGARVDAVEKREEAYTGQFKRFETEQ